MSGDLFYRIGAAFGSLDRQLRDLRGDNGAPPREVAVYDPDSDDGPDPAEGHPDAADTLQDAALAGLAAWLLSGLFRPRPVSWPRVIFAGLAATALADLFGRTSDDAPAGELPYAADPEELMQRFGAGIAVAAGYAALLYPRLPGPPLLRGLAFGALEIAAAPRGGLAHMAARAPGVKFPLQALATPVDEDAGSTAHMIFGTALGLFYRYDGD